MPVKTRNSNGRFVSLVGATNDGKQDQQDDAIVVNLPDKDTILKIIKLIIVFLIISPWLFVTFKKQSLENVTQKITDFYDDNFSCSPVCNCNQTYSNITKETPKNSF